MAAPTSETITAATALHHYRGLNLFNELLTKATHWGWIDKNPAAGVSIPRQTKAMEQRHVFDLDDVRRYLQAAEPQHVAMLATVALGGLRSGEVRGLRRMDLDLEGRRILVRQAIEHGKDGHAYRVGCEGAQDVGRHPLAAHVDHLGDDPAGSPHAASEVAGAARVHRRQR